MQLVEVMPYEILRAMPEPVRATAEVSVVRGHDGHKHPYSVPFSMTISAPGHQAWWAWLNFDQLHVQTPYGAPALLARHLSLLRRIAECRESHDEAEIDPAIGRAVTAICYRPGDHYLLNDPEDMRSRRTEFTRRSLGELAEADPRDFHVYPMLTVSGANSRRSESREEFRIVSRPDAAHRWLFWTHAPERHSDDPVEMAFWFKRHVAQLRGVRRPRWTPAQRDRWFAAVHRELTGRTEGELALDALAAPAEGKPALTLILGSEDSSAGVKHWLIPRENLADIVCHGTEAQISFVDGEDRHRKSVRLLFQNVAAARTVLAEITTGQRRRLGIGEHLRAVVGENPEHEYVALVGLSASEEEPYVAAFTQRHGSKGSVYRSGLSLLLIEPDKFHTRSGS